VSHQSDHEGECRHLYEFHKATLSYAVLILESAARTASAPETLTPGLDSTWRMKKKNDGNGLAQSAFLAANSTDLDVLDDEIIHDHSETGGSNPQPLLG
jgi:hypothetical protein